MYAVNHAVWNTQNTIENKTRSKRRRNKGWGRVRAYNSSSKWWQKKLQSIEKIKKLWLVLKSVIKLMTLIFLLFEFTKEEKRRLHSSWICGAHWKSPHPIIYRCFNQALLKCQNEPRCHAEKCLFNKRHPHQNISAEHSPQLSYILNTRSFIQSHDGGSAF